MKQNIRERILLRLFFLCLITSATFSQALPQTVEQIATPEIEARAKRPTSPKPWHLTIIQGTVPLIDLTASDASLDELASDLSEQLGLPVKLSPVMQNQRVTSKLEEVTIEAAARSLAPLAYVDEVINFPSAQTPQLLGIYLSGVNEPPQPSSNKLKTYSQTDIIFGNIEEDSSDIPSKESTLFIKAENGGITIRAKRQPVAIILYELAQQFGIPFELQTSVDRLIDLDLQDRQLEDVLKELQVSIRLYRQLNLFSGESRPYRVVLVGPQG